MFEEELLNYFEPVDRELNARSRMNSLKQMGRFERISAYNRKFQKWALRIPGMGLNEQIFHYITGLKNHVGAEVEKQGPMTVHEAMRIADRIDNIYGSSRNNNNNYREGRNNSPNTGGPST